MTNRKAAVDAALDKLYSYVDYSMTRAEDQSSAVFSLEKIRRLLARLENPQNTFRSIHVAGTKGKGSVSMLVYSCLRAAGYRVGLYTSPHLIRFNERIQVDGKMIGNDELVQLIDQITTLINPLNPPSTFDLMTAMAFEFFRQKKVEIAVVETGLGGRLDSTNIVKPLLTAITPISLDHTQFLGNTIAEIAREKAGIIKQGVPIVTAQYDPTALTVLRSSALKKKAEFVDVNMTYRSVPLKDSPLGQKLMVWKRTDEKILAEFLQHKQKGAWRPWQYAIRLAGQHQNLNALIAFTVLMKLKSLGYKINQTVLKRGFASAFWPCRFEVFKKKTTIILDGAHNLDSVDKLVQTVNRYYGRKKIVCVIGVSEDKNVREMVDHLAQVAELFILTRSTHPRSLDPGKLLEFVNRAGRRGIVCPTLEDAYRQIKTVGSKSVVLVTGSLFVAGGMREIMMAEDHEIEYYTESCMEKQ